MTELANPKLRVAIIGTGGISRVHAEGILRHRDRVECVALCDISEENLQRRGEQLGGGQAHFGDWRQMLRDYGDHIDAVIICLPHYLHGPAVLDAVAAGKHVLCEKPLCISLEQADEIVAAVARSEIVFMPGHNQLFAPMVRAIKQRVDEGLIGPVRWMRSQDCFLSRGSFGDRWRGKKDLQGGGELIDTGYHATYTLLYFAAAPVVEVRCTMGRFRHHLEGEDSASVQVLFENGVIGEILTSWAFNRPHGTHAIHLVGDTGELFGSDNVLYHLPESATEPNRIELPEVTTFTEQIAYFADCIRHDQRPLHSVEESREVLSVILRATENAEGWERYAVTSREPA